MYDASVAIISIVILIVPFWVLMKRIGRNPFLSLVCLLPYLGPAIVIAIFSFGRWPRFPKR